MDDINDEDFSSLMCYIKGALNRKKPKIPSWLKCCPVRQIPWKDVGSKVPTFKIKHTYPLVFKRQVSVSEVWAVWLGVILAGPSRETSVTHSSPDREHKLQKSAFTHWASTEVLLPLLWRFSLPLFTSIILQTVFVRQTLTRLILPPDSLSTVLPFLAFLTSSVAAKITLLPTLIAYPCFPSL